MSEKTHGASRVSEEAAPMTDSELAQSISEMSKGYGVIYGVPKTYSVNDSEKPVKNTYTQRIPLEDTEVVYHKGVVVSLLVGVVVAVVALIMAVSMIVLDILALFS